MPNVLFTSVGRRVELVRAFRSALKRSNLNGQLIGTDVDWLAPALQAVDVPCCVPPHSSDEFVPALMTICQRHHADIVLPLIDPDIPVLAEHRKIVEATGARVSVVDPDAAAVASDKWLVHEFFERHGLRTPHSWLPTGRERPLDFPMFVKPRRGSASEGTYRVASPDELEWVLPRVRDPILQQFVDGPEITCDVICDFDANVLAVVQRQRLAVRGGEAMKSVTVSHPGVEDACRLIAAKLPARGPITVQCMLEQDEPYFIEINARVGGGLPLAIAAGVDVPAMILSLVSDVPQDGLASSPRIGVYMTRCDESIFLSEADRVKFESHRF